ncbi:hypothetical protein BKP35_17265 [Anaerobacillus arseniciselenatis]|uniref:Uncharacterized protein n=1 Tax=Anaerobacillus arseniciselenatis TaxID=85682 RepID=A0A1S2L9F4_9BACI|nr:hypothetical protein [Anaerobacillus arseniciselenatis]OIJ09149.1 hypothetical protein BKP35_17265 [Anaerobacillus arseniciselenatis]
MNNMKTRLHDLLNDFRKEFKEMFESEDDFPEGTWVEINKEEDIDKKINHNRSLYLIATDCKFYENPCKLVFNEKYKVIYRGEGYHPKVRLKKPPF